MPAANSHLSVGSLLYAPARTTTPPSGVSVRFGSGLTCLNYGAIHFQQVIEKANSFECVSIWVKGGWKETRGVRRPISDQRPVSESRMASLNPFEPKRKKAHAGASSRVCDWFVAEEVGFEPTEGVNPRRFSRPVHSTTLPLLRRDIPNRVTNPTQPVFPQKSAHTDTRTFHKLRIRLNFAQTSADSTASAAPTAAKTKN